MEHNYNNIFTEAFHELHWLIAKMFADEPFYYLAFCIDLYGNLCIYQKGETPILRRGKREILDMPKTSNEPIAKS